MKTELRILFNSNSREWRQLREIFLRAGLAEYARAGPDPIDVYVIKVFEGEPETERFLAALSEEGILWQETRILHYSEAELAAAELLRLVVTKAPRALGGPAYGTTYDLSSACPVCGSGAVQTSPLILKISDVPKRGDVFETVHGEILVAERVRGLLATRGVQLVQAEARTSGEPLPWFQLITDGQLPPMDPETTGLHRERQCPRCGRDGFFGGLADPLQIAYSNIEPADLPDFVSTWELFGNSTLKEPFENSVFAQPLLLLKQDVFRLLREEKIRGVKFDPVRILRE